MKKFFSIILVCLMLLSVSACANGTAVPDESKNTGNEESKGSKDSFKPIVLRYANQHPKDHFATKAAEMAAETIKNKTDGRVTLDIYTDGQLGDYMQIYDEVMMGNVDIVHYDAPETYDSRLTASLLPYLVFKSEDLPKVLGPDSYLYKTVSGIHAEHGVKFLGYMAEGFAGVATKQPVTDPLGLGTDKGVLVRVPPLDVHAVPTIDLGYRTSTIPYSDTFTAIQTGIVDGWQAGTPNLQYLYFRDVINYYYHYKMDVEATQIYMNMDCFNKLLPEDQKIIEETFRDMSLNSMEDLETEDAKYIDMLKDEGIKVFEYTDEELKPLADFCRDKSWKKLASNYEDGENFLKNILADIEK